MSYTAKSIILDVADNWGNSSYTQCRQVDFWYLGSKLALTSSDYTAYGSSYNSSYVPANLFDTGTAKTGTPVSNAWMASGTSSRRISVVFDSAITFDEIRINNAHWTGLVTDRGLQNVEINLSSDSITSTTYNGTITNSTLLYDSTFDEHTTSDVEDEQTLTLIVAGSKVISSPEVVIDISMEAFLQVNISNPEIEAALIADMGDPFYGYEIDLPEIQIPFTASMGSVSEFTAAATGTVVKYFLTITGSADGVENIDLPLSSFQSRRRSGNPTYLQAVIPSVDYIDYLTDRPNGRMIIYQGYEINGEIIQKENIIETSIDDVNAYQGGQNDSIVLIGYTTSTFSPKTVTMAGLTYKATVSGKTRYRMAEPNIFLNPGDTVIVGSDSFIAGVISYSVSAESQQIEIEAA